VKIQLLPSTFNGEGQATLDQRLTCYLIDDCVAVDAGSVAIALSDSQRQQVRDIIVTHLHMDHIASLPIFIDDLFASLKEPIRVHATQVVIDSLERDVFNWNVYPRFSELTNQHGPVMKYVPITVGKEFQVAHFKVTATTVNHIVPTVGLVISDEYATVAFSSDTAETEEFWQVLNQLSKLDAVFIEASFPNSMAELADVTRHFTPASLKTELQKLKHNGVDILAVHLKPTYRATLVQELQDLGVSRLQIMEPGRAYIW